MKLVLFCLLLLSNLIADKTITKTITVNQMLYPKKNLVELKEIAIQKAKEAASKELYGEFLLSETVMVNGKILDDIVREKSGGVIHIKGDPKFSNGENFGDLQVTIEAYATDDDIRDMTPQFITLNGFVYSNPDIPSNKLKLAAEDAFIMEALSSKKPSVRNATASEARKLILSVQISQFDHDGASASYTVSGKIEYIPAFLRQMDGLSNQGADRISTSARTNDSQSRINNIKRGFYGTWNGFVMYSNGSSSDVMINIEGAGQSIINYDSLQCGGDLLIQSKTEHLVSFKEELTYGKDNCINKHKIVLKKLGNTQVLFTQYDENDIETSRGSLYREE